MSRFVIRGGASLGGELTPSGNKNAVLPMLAATLLTDEEVILQNVPRIRDVASMLEILNHLGADVALDGSTVRVRAANITEDTIPQALCNATRTSFLFAGPLLCRVGRSNLFPPGGDQIGRRRLDPHFYGLRQLGVEVDPQRFTFDGRAGRRGRTLFFDEPSVTATEHMLMVAAATEGTTTLLNAACEPHVQDLARLLIGMGAHIEGAGTNSIVVHGVQRLHGASHRVVEDHMEVGSYLAIAAATGGALTISGTSPGNYWMTHRVFERLGIRFENLPGRLVLKGGQQPSISAEAGGAIPCIADGPWPQFASDLMSVTLVLATQARGTVLFFEKMFESRLYFVDPLLQMGANILVCDPHRVVVTGRTPLRAQTVRSPDIRAGMALIMAALCADGECIVQNAEIVDRGYQDLELKLRSMGADIVRA